MSFKIPTPSERQKRLEAEFALATGTQHASLPGTPENASVRVTNIASQELHSHIAYQAKQIFPRTSDTENVDRHASFWLTQSRKQATAATGAVDIVGTNGTVIPEGSVATRPDGKTYSFMADATIGAGGTIEGTIIADDTGADTNIAVGIALTLSTPIVGVTSITVGSDGISGGTDIESDEYLVDRIEDRVQNPPQGGNKTDYERWAKQVAGVTRAWCYPVQYGLGTVGLTFVMDEKEGTIIPSDAEVQNVQDHIDADDVRPVTADVTVFKPTALTIDLDISISPNTTAVQNAIQAELEDFFKREAEPGTVLYLSRIQEAISAAAGEFDHILNSPAANVEPDFGELPVLGDITWSAT